VTPWPRHGRDPPAAALDGAATTTAELADGVHLTPAGAVRLAAVVAARLERWEGP
jgi:hypothetical protein